MKVIWLNLIYYSFLGLTAYFVTPHVLWTLLAIQGFVDGSVEQRQDVTNTIKEGIDND